jgi:hypothetical protein
VKDEGKRMNEKGIAPVQQHATKDEQGDFPTDEKCQRMCDPLEPFIRWEMIFKGIAHVLSHATKDENGSQAGRLCHFIFKGGLSERRTK